MVAPLYAGWWGWEQAPLRPPGTRLWPRSLEKVSAGWANGARLWEGQQLRTLASLSKTDRVFQIGKLRSELEMVSGNVRVMSEMLTELVPTQTEPADLELLQVSGRLSLPAPHLQGSFHGDSGLLGHSGRG